MKKFVFFPLLLLLVFHSYGQKNELNFLLGKWNVKARIKTSEISYIFGNGSMGIYYNPSKDTLTARMDIPFQNFAINGKTLRVFNAEKNIWDVSWHPDNQPPTLNIEGRMLHNRFIEIDYGKDQYGSYIGRLVINTLSTDSISVRKDRLYDDGTLMREVWAYDASRM